MEVLAVEPTDEHSPTQEEEPLQETENHKTRQEEECSLPDSRACLYVSTDFEGETIVHIVWGAFINGNFLKQLKSSTIRLVDIVGKGKFRHSPPGYLARIVGGC